MAAVKHSNFFSTTLATPPTGTTEAAFTVTSATNLPTLAAGDWCYVVLKNASLTREVIKIGTISGVTLTPKAGGRGADGSAAYASWVAGDVIELCFVNASLLDLLYGFKDAFYNTAKTFKSIFVNANTAARTYTFQDRDGNIISDADIVAAAAVTPVDADVMPVIVSSVLKKVTWANLKTIIGANTTGDVKITLKAIADSGWVMMDDKTIGNAASGATGRANADTEALFTLLWTNISNTYCAVSTGRGASAAADYAANKTIALPKTLGRALGISGSGSSLTARALGEVLGAETHTLTDAEGPVHSHPASQAAHSHTTDASETAGGSSAYLLSAPSNGAPIKTFATSSATPAVTVSNNATGGGAHNNMQPTSFINAMVKL